MNNIKISVVIPTYNVSAHLREALDSLLAQTFREFEAICVNDGSTDNSLEILNEYASKDERFRIIDIPNGGYGKAMNRGMAVATGKYLAILEPDDVLPSDAYRILYTKAEEHQLDFIKGGVQRFKAGNNNETVIINSTLYHQEFTNRAITPIDELEVFSVFMNTWTGLYRTDFLQKYNIVHNESPGASFQDNGFFFQTFAYARRMMCINEIVYYCRRDNAHSSIYSMANKPYAMRDEYAFIRQKMMQDSPEIWEKVKPAYLKKRLDNHFFTYENIRDSFKLEYLDNFRKELMELENYDRKLLPPDYERRMKLVLQSPIVFMLSENIVVSKSQQKKKRNFKLISLFYKKTCTRVSYKLLGLPIYSNREKNGRKTYYILSIPVYRKKII